MVPWILLSLACGDGETVSFPPGLEPLETNQAPCPEGSADALELVSGESDWFWSHGCGVVDADYAAVLDAVRTPEVGVDRQRVSEFSVTWDVEPEYEVSYAVDTVVHDLVDVQYILTWRHGDLDEATGATRWLMTETDPFIDLIEGSVLTTRRDDGSVQLEVVYRVGAPAQVDTTTTEGFITRFHESIAAVARGEPLPTYE